MCKVVWDSQCAAKVKMNNIFLLEIKDHMQKIGLNLGFSKIVSAQLQSSISCAERSFNFKHG